MVFPFVLSQRSDVPNAIGSMLITAKSNGHRAKRLRSDNAREFVSEKVESLLRTNEIVHELPAPCCPEQNGRAERQNRTIIEMARTIMMDANLPTSLWGELSRTACFIRNRLPLERLDFRSPYELWTGSPLDLDYFRVIGSDVYVHVPSNFRTKFDSKAEKYVLVGYEPQCKSYRVWKSGSNIIKISRNVRIVEPSVSCDKNRDFNLDSLCSSNVAAIDRASSIQTRSTAMPASDNAPVVEDRSDDDMPVLERQSREDDEVHPSLERSCHNSEDGENDATEEDQRGSTDVSGCTRAVASGSPIRTRAQGAAVAPSSTDLNLSIIVPCLSVTPFKIPSSYREAICSEHGVQWLAAMGEELDSLHRNAVWTLIDRSKCVRRPLKSRCIFRVKLDADGEVSRFKARIVIQGCFQTKRIDYFETFSPVARCDTIRPFLSITAQFGYHLRQFDIKTAFLHGELAETVYMEQPDGFTEAQDLVCLLQKSLYGLKQAPRAWNAVFTSFLSSCGLVQSKHDTSLFIGSDMMVVVYVDDGLVAARSVGAINPPLVT